MQSDQEPGFSPLDFSGSSLASGKTKDPCQTADRLIRVLFSCSIQINELQHEAMYILITKHTYRYSNILKISPPKTESFQIKILIFHISAQNIDCGYSLELPH